MSFLLLPLALESSVNETIPGRGETPLDPRPPALEVPEWLADHIGEALLVRWQRVFKPAHAQERDVGSPLLE
jgi:hypothetical protein